MEIWRRLRRESQLVNDRGSWSVAPTGPIAEISSDAGCTRVERANKIMRPRTESEQQALRELDGSWYSSEFDSVRYCLERIPSDFELISTVPDDPFKAMDDVMDGGDAQRTSKFYLEEQLAHYDRLRELVCCKLSSQVLQNYAAFIEGMQKIQEIELDLAFTLVIVASTRRGLSRVMNESVTYQLQIVQMQRRMLRIQNVSATMLQVQNVMQLVDDFTFAINEQNFPAAIKHLNECRAAVISLDEIVSLTSIRQRLQVGEEEILAALSKNLEAACTSVDASALERVACGYLLLERQEVMGDLVLQIHFQNLDCACEEVTSRYKSATLDVDNPRDVELSIDFVSRCHCVDPSSFVQCVYAMLDSLSHVLYCYFKVRQIIDVEVTGAQSDNSSKGGTEILRRALASGRRQLWGRAQHRLSQMLHASKVARDDLKLADVLDVMHACQQFMEIGERFSGSDSNVLRSALNDKCRWYFDEFHKQCVDRLRLAIESDSWCPMPLQTGFGLADIKTLRYEQYQYERRNGSTSGSRRDLLDPDVLFTLFAQNAKLFHRDESVAAVDRDVVESPSAVSLRTLDCSDASAFAREAFTRLRSDGSGQLNDIVATASSLVLARYCGEYIAFMRSLDQIAEHAFISLTQLFDIYLYVVYSTFCYDPARFSNSVLQSYFQEIAKTIQEGKFCCSLVTPVRLNSSSSSIDDDGSSIPRIACLQLDLSTRASTWGIIERLAAVESLERFLGHLVKWIDPVISLYVAKNFRVRLLEFATVFAQVTDAMRDNVYLGLAQRMTAPHFIVSKIKLCKWDLSELSTHQNVYVDDFLNMLKRFQSDIADARNRCAEYQVVLSGLSLHKLLTSALTHAVPLLVDGYAGAKKCSTEGRAAMSLDLRMLARGIENIVNFRPIPCVEFVDAYIKAYYLPPEDFLKWVSEHPEYTLNHHLSLAAVGPSASLNKKGRQAYLKQVELATLGAHLALFTELTI